MTISLAALVRRLDRSKAIDEWVVRELVESTTSRKLGPGDRGLHSKRHHFEVTVFRDRRAARGEAIFRVGRNDDAILERRLADAAERAQANSGPSWQLIRPSAPARVRIFDEQLALSPAEGESVIAAQLADLQRGASVATAEIKINVSRHRVAISTGFDHSFAATRVSVGATMSLGDAVRAVRAFFVDGVRLTDLALKRTVDRHAQLLASMAGATRVTPGTYDLVVSAGALKRSPHVDSWLAPLAVQASARRSRLGLSRYQPGQAAFEPAGGDPISVRSNGTLDFAIESAPVDRLGGPVRSFALVERGQAAGLAFDSKEAALQNEACNGGARNLTLAAGTRSWGDLAVGDRPRLVVSAFERLRVDELSGEVIGQIAVGNTDTDTVHSGVVSFNLFDVLGRLRLSSEDRSGPPHFELGAAWIGIPEIEVR